MSSENSITISITGRAVCQMFFGVQDRTQDVQFNLTFGLTRWR